MNLLEFSYFLIKEGKAKDAREIFDKFSKFSVDYDKEILIRSAEMKFRLLKERVSLIDCSGYNAAKKHNIKFLTGDEKFRYRDNVEFVK